MFNELLFSGVVNNKTHNIYVESKIEKLGIIPIDFKKKDKTLWIGFAKFIHDLVISPKLYAYNILYGNPTYVSKLALIIMERKNIFIFRDSVKKLMELNEKFFTSEKGKNLMLSIASAAIPYDLNFDLSKNLSFFYELLPHGSLDDVNLFVASIYDMHWNSIITSGEIDFANA